ncbi:hypothetical protein [Pectobacterium versatile]|uniref:hypothetical protein n=1 Tax=Pectobacterium versatile TaxID=2488639 RepID=UPI001CC9C416|nr:hypothetical protein [Pectobacterium versatile]
MSKLLSLSELLKDGEIKANDILSLAIDEEISILINMDDIKIPAVRLIFSSSINELNNWIENPYIKNQNYKGLTKFSLFKESNFDDLWGEFCEVDSNIDMQTNNGKESYFNAYLHGVWRLNKHYIKNSLILGRLSTFDVGCLLPFGDLNNSDFLRISPEGDYKKHATHDVYITYSDYNKVYNYLLDKGYVSKKRLYSYASQQNAQLERHALNREKVLMAAISLNVRYPNECSKNPTRWGSLLWERREDYWPNEKPPLTKDEIIRLLRKAVKFYI